MPPEASLISLIVFYLCSPFLSSHEHPGSGPEPGFFFVSSSELQAASEDWMSEYTDGTTTTTTTAAVADIRRTSQVIAGSRTTVNSSTSIASAGDYLPAGATELIKKSIRRSWTISSEWR